MSPTVIAESSRCVQRTDILLIEDYEDLAEVTRLFLESQGYSVKSTNSIAEAVNAARREEYRLVLSDWSLPDGTGVDALKQLRSLGGFEAVAMSGYEGGEFAATCRAAGFSECLVKPVDDHVLLATVQRLLGR